MFNFLQYLSVLSRYLIFVVLIVSLTGRCTSKKKVDLKAKAGVVNEMIVFERYDDIYPLMTEALKPIITRALYQAAIDSVNNNLGEFIKALDTTFDGSNNMKRYFIKNQYKNGVSQVQIMFDDEAKLLGVLIDQKKL